MPELVGQIFKILMSWPQVLLQCMCPEKGAQVIVITGLMNMVRCPQCGRGYLVHNMNPDGTFNIVITPPEAQPQRIM